MQNTLFKQYSDLRAKKRAIEQEEEQLKTLILDEMQKENMNKADTSYGKFTVAHRTSWTYSDKVKKLEEDLKVRKFTEQEKGIASSRQTPYLLFTDTTQDDKSNA